MATMTIPRVCGWLVALALSGCGGGDFQGDLGADGPAVEAAAPRTPVVAAGRDGNGIAAAAASAPAGELEATLRIRRQPQAAAVGEGEIVQFGVDVEGPRLVTYQWLRDELPIDGETGPVLRLRVNAADHLARMSVIVRAGRHTVHSDAAVLRVS